MRRRVKCGGINLNASTSPHQNINIMKIMSLFDDNIVMNDDDDVKFFVRI